MQKFTKDEIIYNIISKLTKDIEFLELENYSKDISTKKLKIILRCKLHNISKIIKYSSFILNGWHCPECSKIKRTLPENIAIERIQKSILKKNNEGSNISFLGFVNFWKGSSTKLILKCNIHNHIWDTTRLGIFLKHEGKYCIYCSKTSSISFMENSLYSILNSYYLNIIRQYKLIINNRIFYLDFYIPKLNVIIEYDGKQHYEFTSFFQPTYQNFVNQVNRDRCLEQYCKENNIKLLRISYKDNNRIPEIIKIFFEEGKDITTKVEPKLLPVLYHG